MPSAKSWVTRDVLYILLNQVLFGFGWSLYLLTPKFLATELHADPETLGRISAMGGAGGVCTIPLAAFALDRLGRRVFFRLGCTVLVLLSFGFTRVHDLGPLVYALQACISAAFVLAFNASAALLTDYAPPERLGQAIGWVGGMNVAMNAVSTMIAEPLAAHDGWDAVFSLGIAAGVTALAASLLLRESSQRPRTSDPHAPSGTGALRARIYGPLFASWLSGAVFVSMFGFIQPYALSQGATQVRAFFLGFTLSAVAGRFMLGGLGDRLGRRRVSLWALAGYALSTFVVRGLSPDLLLAYGLVFGAAHGVLYPTLNALALESLPARRRGLGMVLYNGAFNVGSSMGSLGWGMMAKQHGYEAMYALSTATALIAGASLFFGKKPRAPQLSAAKDPGVVSAHEGPSMTDTHP